jgi:lyso-ornithine lipid O-acyltransferase
VKSIRLVRRFLFFVFYTAYIVAEVWLRSVLLRGGIRTAMRIRSRWAGNLLKGVGMRVVTDGEAPQYPCIVVANHRSYIDPLFMLKDMSGYPVAKAEIADWPLLGYGSRMAGILFVYRADAGSRVKTIRAIQKVLSEGYPVIIFPEADTSDLPGALPFKRAVFEIAARMQTPVVPVALCFENILDCWVTQESFLSHAFRRFGESHIGIRICYGPALRASDAGYLQTEARTWIEARLAQYPMGA